MSLPSEFAYPKYEPTNKLVKVIVILLLLELAFGIPTDIIQLIQNPQTASSAPLEAAGLALGAVSGLAGFANFVLSLLFVYRANKNLPSLGGTQLEFTPKWAVIWWFIPIANMWKPYYMVQELMKASDPSVGKTDLYTRRQMDRPPYVAKWWASTFALIGAAIVQSILAMGRASATLVPLVGIIYISVALEITTTVYIVLDIIMVWFTIRLVREIDRRQAEKIKAINLGNGV